MRCAYICAYSNKQIVLITPSTILTDQHFNSFTKRFKNFPLSIKKLNRHTSLKQRNEIINDFNDHKIDILITTHIAFSNIVDFKNTGLLIIDEEHKFGIKQKNFIKDKQSNIHILYLSATPIP
jgi:transcription-repair coupling factor (superfamily II helicase)